MQDFGFNLDQNAIALQQAQTDLRMEQEGVAAAEESLFSIKQLQSVMSSQRALYAARGQNSAQGSAAAIQDASQRTYNEDERAMNLSREFRKNYLKSQKSVLQSTLRANSIARSGDRAQQGASLLNQGFNMFSFNSLMDSNPFALSGKGLDKKGNSRGYDPNKRMTQSARNNLLKTL